MATLSLRERFMRRINIWVGMVVFGISVLIYVMTFKFKATLISDNYTGPAFFPRIVAISLALLSITLIVTSLIRQKDLEKKEAEINRIFNKTMFRPLAASAFLMIYVLFLLEFLGFTISSIILFIVLLLITQTRKKIFYFIAPLFVIGVSLLFRYGFLVQLPTGFVGF